MDHDQRLKELLRQFFAKFLNLFFREWAEMLDLSEITWMDKEIFPNPPEGSLHVLDLVAQVKSKSHLPGYGISEGDPCHVLVHVEVESSDSTTGLKVRFPVYYIYLRDKYGLPVLPIAVYLKASSSSVRRR
jgi:hypothetical protein